MFELIVIGILGLAGNNISDTLNDKKGAELMEKQQEERIWLELESADYPYDWEGNNSGIGEKNEV